MSKAIIVDSCDGPAMTYHLQGIACDNCGRTVSLGTAIMDDWIEEKSDFFDGAYLHFCGVQCWYEFRTKVRNNRKAARTHDADTNSEQGKE